ncbi:MAG TPA: glutamine--fructose-6-phosphate transaminase (isomerizing) [Myxococcales bacterium]|nr:glutamine--fructose-6-phosphate transaminase (isomerizing) [Myxococcales bacterium]HIN84916.1 glutamine--fructose-6-phosphate transaminase (isomerizing) [Myxococcales bacterium]
MCGIIGYVGPRQCAQLILDGLRRLEYRGYDSAGVAVIQDGEVTIRREAGKLDRLAQNLAKHPISGSLGIGHTRWATHGAPTEANAHPHSYQNTVVVHNGIIENHLEIKAQLVEEGHVFTSETDTEIIAHLVARERSKGLELPEAVRAALTLVHGAYAIAVLDQTVPDLIVAAKNASPLVVGLGEDENFLASDIPAILNHTRQMLFLGEGEMAVLTSSGVSLQRIEDGAALEVKPETITWSPTMAEKGGYRHFMLKEIHEQPRAVVDTMRGRIRIEHNQVDLPGLSLSDEELAAFQRIVVIACGTSWHAGLIGEYLMEQFARVPVEVELASEFRYRKPVVDEKCLVIAITQSGETADTLAAVKEAQQHGAVILGICNVVGSTITRVCDNMIMTLAGPEVSVASTKAFTTQIVALYLLAVKLGIVRGALSDERVGRLLQDLMEIPAQMEDLLHQAGDVYLAMARRFSHSTNMLYLGRGLSFPIALEGALKLKELSYIHAEGYAAGEMKHGPIALIDEDVPTVVVAPNDRHFEKSLANVAEVKARGGLVIAVTSGQAATDKLMGIADEVLTIPEVPEHVHPLLAALPMQLLAYHIADFKGTDVDQPRNLAKSVTVE